VVVHPSGKFAYIANEGGFTPTSVSMYSVDTSTGSLTSLGTIAAGGRANSIALDPTGKFAYVADGTENSDGSPGTNVSMYSIDTATGNLTSLGLIAAGTQPSSVAVDPTGKFVYVTNSGSNDISVYTVNVITGALTVVGTIPV
jgi:6-phosphogluconolactonase (cycloisomerase 2 family)